MSNVCGKTYKKTCFLSEKCYIIWRKEDFPCIFAAVKNKKTIP